MRILMLLGFLLGNVAQADDATDAGAKLYEYFEIFNAKNMEQIADYIYATPVLIGGGEGHLVREDVDSVVQSLTNTYQQIESLGWKESVIANIKTCVLSANLALVDTQYSRMTDEGQSIPPAIRTILYVLQKIEGDWRIIAFFGHDPERRPSCD